MSELPSTPVIKNEPFGSKFILPGDCSSPKDINFYINSNNQTNSTPISAIFLVQFDVKTGYELKWYKTIDENISLKGVEFKSLPSGLHEVAKEVISFVLPKPDSDVLLYGVSVYHQNEAMGQSRDNVRMFSLGILVDPALQSSKYLSGGGVNWKPIDYTKGLEYVDQLDELLTKWNPEENDYEIFETFFEDHSSVIDILKSPRTPLKQSFKLSAKHHSHHSLLKLPLLLEHLGPLIFKIWRSTILRERVFLFDAPSVELNCAFGYCLSIISSIPQDLISKLDDSNLNLRFIQPIYSIGVNDIDWLKTLTEKSFIASSTDEILLYKTQLYDLAVQFNSLHPSQSKKPNVAPSSAAIPNNYIPSFKATQRDLKRFKILVDIFDLNKDIPWINEVTEPTTWKQLTWSGFYWWASAGEKIEDEAEYENLLDVELIKGDIEKSLFLVGYFQSMIRRLFNTVLNLLSNENIDDDDDLSEVPLVIEFNDLIEMGVDPYSKDDKEFVLKFVKTWWNRDVKFGSFDLCCF